MYNWRLLLFAFFAFFQPIASFTERNLVDGRQQCCDHRLSRDTRSLYDYYPFKQSSETSRLNYNREERRDEFRNENTILIRPQMDTARDLRKREAILISPERMTRLSRTDSWRMSNRDATPEQTSRGIRDPHRSSDERIRVLDDSASRLIRISRKNERRSTGNLVNRNQRIVHQREERRRISNNNAESGKYREIETKRSMPHEFNRVAGRLIDMKKISVQNPRQNNLEWDNDRIFAQRGKSILNERLFQSLDRLSRHTAGSRRLSLEGNRAWSVERRTQRNNIKIENERNYIPYEVRFREIVHLNREQSSRIMALVHYDNDKNLGLGQNNYIRDYGERQEIRNNDRVIERRITRERMNSERFSSQPKAELRRIQINRENKLERLIITERRNHDIINRSPSQGRTTSMDTIKIEQQTERRNRDMPMSRLSRKLRETVIAEHRQPSVVHRLRENTRLSRNQVREEQFDRRNIDTQRRHERIYDENREQRERRREVRRDVRERERSQDTEKLIIRREIRERARSLEHESLIGRRDVHERTRAFEGERLTGQREVRERARSLEHESLIGRREVHERIRALESERLPEQREVRERARSLEHESLIGRREVRERVRALESERQFRQREVRERTRSLEVQRILARRETRERTRSSEVERLVRADERRNFEINNEDKSQRISNEKRFRERTLLEHRLSFGRLAPKNINRDHTFDRSRDVSRMRNSEQLVEKRIDIFRNKINNTSHNGNLNVNNWQYLMYTLQAIYLCTIFLPLMNKSNTNRKIMSMDWGAPFNKLIKVD